MSATLFPQEKTADLDIERLHAVIEASNEHSFTERGQGRTTTFVVLMVREILRGDPSQTYVYVDSTYGPHLLTAVKPGAGEVCTVADQRFLFYSADSQTCRICGTTIARAFCDVYDYNKRARVVSDMYRYVRGRGSDVLY